MFKFNGLSKLEKVSAAASRARAKSLEPSTMQYIIYVARVLFCLFK